MIILSASMPKAGSAWYYSMTNDLLVAAGYTDSRIIREKYHLQSILTGGNCFIDPPSSFKFMVLIPHFLGNTFAVKTHKGPTRNYRMLNSLRIAKATYIYRDPRDAALSVFEHGQLLRTQGKDDGFIASLDTMEKAIYSYIDRLKTWEAWIKYGKALNVKYENLLSDPMRELERLAMFLSLKISKDSLKSIISVYEPEILSHSPGKLKKLHFNKGVVGRFRDMMTSQEQELCLKLFGEHLQRMGYRE